jgi:hypothetical protein
MANICRAAVSVASSYLMGDLNNVLLLPCCRHILISDGRKVLLSYVLL